MGKDSEHWRLSQHTHTSLSLQYAPSAQNMYHVLDMGEDEDNSATDITVPTVVAAAAAATMASLLGQGINAGSVSPGLIAVINQSIAPAFNQFMHNQSVLQNQIAMIPMVQPPPAPAPVQHYIVPPPTSCHIPYAAAIPSPYATATLPANCWF